MRLPGIRPGRLAAVLPDEVSAATVTLGAETLPSLALTVRPHPGILDGFINGLHGVSPGDEGSRLNGPSQSVAVLA